ncbi:MAG: hypothetical protein JJU00_09795 [Opitutales bacterium]|nr:hypothetical protein [Opitutales bacterium]
MNKERLLADGEAKDRFVAELRVVGAYIELNPVRAGLAERAETYRWSGWGAATGGEVPQSQRAWARAGIAGLLGGKRREEDEEEARKFLESYGLLVRVKDDMDQAGREGLLRCGEAAGSREADAPLLTRIPGLLRGAAVGTLEYVCKAVGSQGRSPGILVEEEGGVSLHHAKAFRVRDGEEPG